MATWENGYGWGMDALISLMCCLTEPKTGKGLLIWSYLGKQQWKYIKKAQSHITYFEVLSLEAIQSPKEKKNFRYSFLIGLYVLSVLCSELETWKCQRKCIKTCYLKSERKKKYVSILPNSWWHLLERRYEL